MVGDEIKNSKSPETLEGTDEKTVQSIKSIINLIV
jgi:hypothetical protein